MDEQLRFYEQEGGKISYGDLQPIVFESTDHMPPSTPQNLLPASQKQFTFEGTTSVHYNKYIFLIKIQNSILFNMQ